MKTKEIRTPETLVQAAQEGWDSLNPGMPYDHQARPICKYIPTSNCADAFTIAAWARYWGHSRQVPAIRPSRGHSFLVACGYVVYRVRVLKCADQRDGVEIMETV